MALPQLRTERYTYADYASWPEDVRYELLDGVAYAMTPAPSDKHQAVLGELFFAVRSALEDSPCQVRMAPYDVLLDAPERGRKDAEQVVQPDLVVICDRGKIKPHGCEGVPDLVVEIVSPSSNVRDYVEKLRAYERFGVPEYWILEPDAQRLNVFRITEASRLDPVASLTPEDVAESSAVPGLTVELAQLFGSLSV